MKYLNEYRDGKVAQTLAQAIQKITTRDWRIMEVCGGQTHAIVKFGIDQLLPSQITLLHGPGCPVCVTPLEKIDRAIAIASRPEVLFCSFGDMLRVPGSEQDLLSVQAKTGRVHMVYSPMDALKLAKKHPDKEVVFFAVGFETTAPANAMAVYQAKQQGLKNFSMLVSHVLVPPALESLLNASDCQVQGFLAAGHVCTIMGFHEYEPIAKKYQVPIVVTGFEPLDILQGVHLCIKQLEEGRAEVENQYTRSVKYKGNLPAQSIIEKVFHVQSQKWRGVGEIPQSGLVLREEYAEFDAEKRFTVENIHPQENPECISGLILQGIKQPLDCPAFAKICNPEHPLGATMVSSEGACAAYYQYRKLA